MPAAPVATGATIISDTTTAAQPSLADLGYHPAEAAIVVVPPAPGTYLAPPIIHDDPYTALVLICVAVACAVCAWISRRHVRRTTWRVPLPR